MSKADAPAMPCTLWCCYVSLAVTDPCILPGTTSMPGRLQHAQHHCGPHLATTPSPALGWEQLGVPTAQHWLPLPCVTCSNHHRIVLPLQLACSPSMGQPHSQSLQG